jgi:hypothetical protein
MTMPLQGRNIYLKKRPEDTKHNWINQTQRLEHERHAKQILKYKPQEEMDLGGS